MHLQCSYSKRWRQGGRAILAREPAMCFRSGDLIRVYPASVNLSEKGEGERKSGRKNCSPSPAGAFNPSSGGRRSHTQVRGGQKDEIIFVGNRKHADGPVIVVIFKVQLRSLFCSCVLQKLEVLFNFRRSEEAFWMKGKRKKKNILKIPNNRNKKQT